MTSNDENIRATIADQAGEWFVANDEGPMDARDSAALAAWVKASPVHVEEFLGVSVVARDLKEARTDPEYSLEAILARARAEDGPPVKKLRPRMIEAVPGIFSRRGFPPAAAMAMALVLSLGLLLTWNPRPSGRPAGPPSIATQHFETRHGEQLTQRLADNSVLHLNTDSAVSVRYSKSERLVMLLAARSSLKSRMRPIAPSGCTPDPPMSGTLALDSMCAWSRVRPSSRWSRAGRGRSCHLEPEPLGATD